MSTAHKLSARAVTLWNKGADARDPESACFTSSSNSGNLPPIELGDFAHQYSDREAGKLISRLIHLQRDGGPRGLTACHALPGSRSCQVLL